MPASARKIAPGPPGHLLFGHLREFRRDVLGLLLESAQRYGDVVRFRLGPQVVHLINSPEGAEHVLHKRASNYDKDTRSARVIRTVCGDSLLSSNGPSWQSQRKLLQPSFHAQSVKRYADTMVRATGRMLDSWQPHTDRGDSFDLASEMMKLTYGVAAKCLFASDQSLESDAIEDAMQVILPHTWGRLEKPLSAPLWVPTPSNRRFKAALATIDTVVARLVDAHRTTTDAARPGDDLLSVLMSLRDSAGKPSLTDRQIRDHTITFLLAGHETTSNALTWTLYLLAKYPDAQTRVRNEVCRLLGRKTPPTVGQLPELEETGRVVREAMRLYPPIWIIERRVIAEDQVCGFTLPAGSAVVVCPYTLHRHPAYWEDPDAFRPERFAQPASSAYIPFGAGPRYCIGSEFAMQEALLVTASILQRYKVDLASEAAVQPWPGITLRTRNGLPAIITPLDSQ